MSSIRKRNGKYQAQVRINGSSVTRSFRTKSEASSWARHQEARLETRKANGYKPSSLAEILQRYLKDVTPLKRNTSFEPGVIRMFMKEAWAHKPIDQISVSEIAAYRDKRLESIKPSSLHRQFCILKHACTIAEREWEWMSPSHVFNRVSIKRQPAQAIKRVSDQDIEKLIDASKDSRNDLIGCAIILAVETGLRRSELLSLEWDDIDTSEGLISLSQTKSGYPRQIPITRRAMAVMSALRARNDASGGRLLPMTANALKHGFQRLRKRAGLEHIRFHDLRHEAVSRLFEKGLTPPEVASVSGHRTLSQLMRYSHADLNAVADKMKKADEAQPIQLGPIRLE